MPHDDAPTKPVVGLLFVGRKRPGFDPEWGRAMTDAVRNAVARAGFQTVEPPHHATDEPTFRQAIAECTRAGAQVLVVLQTTIGDGRLVPVLAQQWSAPVILWATPENPQSEKVSSCSLVGTHVWASTFRQLGRPFEIVYGDPRSDDTLRQFREAVSIAYTARRLRHAKAALVGHPAPGFLALQADRFNLHRALGVQLHHFTLTEFIERVRALGEAQVTEDIDRFQAMKIPLDDVTEDIYPTASRLYLAMRDLMGDENVEALALRCWPELPNTLGQWPYVGMTRLLSQGLAVALEGDVDGAVSLFIGNTMGFGCGYLSDWLEHDRETVTLWHPGCPALPLCYPVGHAHGPTLARQFNDQNPGICQATLRVGRPVTLFRLWRCDDRYHLTACDAETVEPARRLKGDFGRVRIPDRHVPDWFHDLCHAGMPHHLAVFGGHHAGQLRRLARTLALHWIP